MHLNRRQFTISSALAATLAAFGIKGAKADSRPTPPIPTGEAVPEGAAFDPKATGQFVDGKPRGWHLYGKGWNYAWYNDNGQVTETGRYRYPDPALVKDDTPEARTYWEQHKADDFRHDRYDTDLDRFTLPVRNPQVGDRVRAKLGTPGLNSEDELIVESILTDKMGTSYSVMPAEVDDEDIWTFTWHGMLERHEFEVIS